ncbi:MAG: glycine cleavage system protein GcvH [Methanomassiliicoccales archaeon]
MSEVRDGLLYTKDHEWSKVEGDRVRIGITDHAQHELTDLAFIQLPKLGQKVKQGEALAIVESVKNTADVFSSVTGEVVEVNSPLEEDPAAVNTDPYGRGWLAVVKASNASELRAMMDADAYRELLKRGGKD